MSSFSFGKVAEELQDINEEGLSFEDKQLSWNTAEDVEDVVNALETTKIVHYLKLEGNTLGIDAAVAIGKALVKHPEFRKALWKNMFTRRLKNEIPLALRSLSAGLILANAQLTVLDLSDNALGPNGMVGIEVLLRSHVCYSLQELRLSNCGLGIDGSKMLACALIDCHRKSITAGTPLRLKTFVAGRNRMENNGATAIAAVFKTLKSLEVIEMPQNSIYHPGIAVLAESFQHNPNLQVLNLNDNTVKQKGASALANVFAFLPNLREINLGDCLLKSSGAYCFCVALELQHTQLEHIDFSFNEIGADAGLTLVQAMQNKHHLRKINLDGNQFGKQGRERIIEAMQKCKNQNALEPLDEDQSEEEEDDVVSSEDDDDYDEVKDKNYHQNNTTEEAHGDGYKYNEDGKDAVETENKTVQEVFDAELFKASVSAPAPQNISQSQSAAESTTTTTAAAAEETKLTAAEDFCLSVVPCSLQKFEALPQENTQKVLIDVINRFSGEDYLVVLTFTTLKCAHLSEASALALDVAMGLFKYTFDYAVRNNRELRVVTDFLTQLELIKSEEKFDSPYNIKSCRYALRQTLMYKEIPSDYIKNAFTQFLNDFDQLKAN